MPLLLLNKIVGRICRHWHHVPLATAGKHWSYGIMMVLVLPSVQVLNSQGRCMGSRTRTALADRFADDFLKFQPYSETEQASS
jgi:hypothetical protein